LEVENSSTLKSFAAWFSEQKFFNNDLEIITGHKEKYLYFEIKFKIN